MLTASGHLPIPTTAAGLETRNGPPRTTGVAHWQPQKLENLQKTEQEGRIPLQRWPARVLLPFLTEDLYRYYHKTATLGKPQPPAQILNLVTEASLTKVNVQCKPVFAIVL